MTIHAEVNPAQLAAAKRKLDPSLYVPAVEAAIHTGSSIALNEAQSATQDLGGIPSSFGVKTTPMGAEISSRHAGAIIAEFGRRAGAKMPPPDALARYGDVGVQFVIARAIARRGIKGRFFMRKAFNRLFTIDMPRLLDEAKRAIAQRWMAR